MIRSLAAPARAALLAALALLLAVGVVVAPPATSPAEAARMFCTSSIDPKCQPQNLPILIELGMATAPGGATASTGATAGIVTAGGAALVGVNAFQTVTPCGSNPYCAGPGILRDKGFEGVSYEPDPSWVPPSTGDRVCIPGIGGGELRQIANYPTLGALALCNIVRNGSSWQPTATFTGTPGSLTATLDVFQPGASETWQFRWICWNAGTGIANTGTPAGTVRTLTQDSPMPLAVPQSTCGSGFVPLFVTWPGISTSWNNTTNHYVLYGTAGPYSVPAPSTVDVTTNSYVECLGPGGTTTRPAVSWNTVGYAVGSSVAGGIPFPDALCNPGELAVGGGLEVSHDGGTSWTTVGEATAPEVITNLPTEFPDCFVIGSDCRLTLWKVQPSGGLEYCGTIGQLCYGWNLTPLDLVDAMYKCKYGQYAVDIRYCSAFRDPTVGVQPNVDPDTGELLPITAPNTVGSPSTPVDPVTGNPLPESSDDPQARECWPSGWGVLNPFSWVYMPAKCALEDAFIPRPSVVTSTLVGVGAAWQASTPGIVVDTLGAMDFEIPTGCGGISVDMSWLSVGGWSLGTFQFMQACPGQFFAGFAAATKIIGYLGFTVAGIIGVTRQIGRIFGYGGLSDSGGDS